jgi:hypothetical protein
VSKAPRATPLKIIALCIAAAVVYGVLCGQVTAHVCVEFFTVGHPRVFVTYSPTLLGLGWGVMAWWVGLILGAMLAFAATRGPRPQRSAASLVRPIVILLAITGEVAFAAGLLGWYLGTKQWVLEPLASLVPQEHRAAFIAVLNAHSTSYFVAFVGSMVLIHHTWKSRGRSSVRVAVARPQLPPWHRRLAFAACMMGQLLSVFALCFTMVDVIPEAQKSVQTMAISSAAAALLLFALVFRGLPPISHRFANLFVRIALATLLYTGGCLLLSR